MLNACFDEQVEVKQTFIAGLDHTKDGSTAQMIFGKCSERWSRNSGTDWVMAVQCPKDQMQAFEVYRSKTMDPVSNFEFCSAARCDQPSKR